MHNNQVFLHTYLNITIKNTLNAQVEYGRKIHNCTLHSHLCTILLGSSFLQTLKTCDVNPCHPYFHIGHFLQFTLCLATVLKGNPTSSMFIVGDPTFDSRVVCQWSPMIDANLKGLIL
jgi:hypothetical protein